MDALESDLSTDEKILLGLNDDYIHSDQNSDAARYDEFLADDFTASLPDLVFRNRQEFLDLIAQPRPFTGLTLLNVKVRILGDVALLQGRVRYTTKHDGQEREALYTDTYQRRGHRWMCVAGEVVAQGELAQDRRPLGSPARVPAGRRTRQTGPFRLLAPRPCRTERNSTGSCRRRGRRREPALTSSVKGMGKQHQATVREIPLTARGAATRDRIVHAAADLMYVKGVNATTLDDIREATGTSKSQLYRHFPDKETLVRAVIALRGQQVIERETGRLGRFNSFSGLVRWRNALVAANALQNGAYGCALGSMANELADHDEQARAMLADLFRNWEELIAAGLRRMQAKGTLKPNADAGQLAISLMAAVQGGYLLANTAHDVKPMETSIDLALEHLKSYLVDDE